MQNILIYLDKAPMLFQLLKTPKNFRPQLGYKTILKGRIQSLKAIVLVKNSQTYPKLIDNLTPHNTNWGNFGIFGC